MVDTFVEMFEMEIVEKKGTSCRRLIKRCSYRQSPKSPNTDCSFWHPNGVSCPYEHLWIGISGSADRHASPFGCQNGQSGFGDFGDCRQLVPSFGISPFRKFMPPKRRFWKTEQKIGRAFSMQFSMNRCPNRVLTCLKSTFKSHARYFVLSSKIFVWGS